MKHFTYTHCAGDKAVSAANRKHVVDAITAVTIKPGPGSATKNREQLIASLKTSGWSGEVKLAADSDMTITSVKDDVGLCLQTGNMGTSAAFGCFTRQNAKACPPCNPYVATMLMPVGALTNCAQPHMVNPSRSHRNDPTRNSD